VLGVMSVVTLTVTVLEAALRVRRLRDRGCKVRPLHHDVELPGRYPPRTIAVLGDSAAAGHGLPDPECSLARRVGRRLTDGDGRATAVRCVALDGATTAEVLRTQVGAAVDAEVVLIGVGANDAVRPRQSIAEAADTLRSLLLEVRSRTVDGGRVVVLSCPDLSVAPGLPLVLRPAVGRRCRALATAQQQVAADLGVAVVRADRAALGPEMFGPDGFHPGPLGHDRLAADVLDRLRSP
jgi:lysophospholipase L1-like esterase